MLIHDKENARFNWEENDVHAFIDYRIEEERYVLYFSYVPPQNRGQGVARRLTEAAFDYLLEHKIKAYATCRYIQLVALRKPKYEQFASVN